MNQRKLWRHGHYRGPPPNASYKTRALSAKWVPRGLAKSWCLSRWRLGLRASSDFHGAASLWRSWPAEWGIDGSPAGVRSVPRAVCPSNGPCGGVGRWRCTSRQIASKQYNYFFLCMRCVSKRLGAGALCPADFEPFAAWRGIPTLRMFR